MTMGESLKAARKSRNLTQKKLAELSGLYEKSVRDYEKGYARPRLDAAMFIADALNLSLEEVFTGAKAPFCKKVMTYSEIGHNMRMCRRAHGLRVVDLSGKTGIRADVLYRAERGISFTTMDNIITFTSVLGVTLDEYIGRV